MTTHVAVDLGASSGRVFLGEVANDKVSLHEVSRFENEIVALPGRDRNALYWDFLHLWNEIRHALKTVRDFDTVGVDSWAVDYALLNGEGLPLGIPRSYRDPRTRHIPEQFYRKLSSRDLFALNGLQRQDFNTMFQLIADQNELGPILGQATRLALLPDLIAYWLTGELVTEVTNASTTGFIDPQKRTWNPDVFYAMKKFGVDAEPLFGSLVEPGTPIGKMRRSVGINSNASVVAVATHDTASAVAAVPASTEHFAYISCGTWSLVGTELTAPILTSDAYEANFTNELGVDGTTRFLKNVMGLWIFNECFKEWKEEMPDISYESLNRDVSSTKPLRTLIDVNDKRFYPPGPMAERISDYAIESGQEAPRNPSEFYRCIMESLALEYARVIKQTSELSGKDFDRVHMVGGGIRNEFLCQLTADATQLEVVAGPVEATVMGNVLVQAQAQGVLPSDRKYLRATLRNSVYPKVYKPSHKSRKQSFQLG